jgi:hypothetical protein
MAYTRESMCMNKTQTINLINNKFYFHSKQRELLYYLLQNNQYNEKCNKVSSYFNVRPMSFKNIKNQKPWF